MYLNTCLYQPVNILEENVLCDNLKTTNKDSGTYRYYNGHANAKLFGYLHFCRYNGHEHLVPVEYKLFMSVL